MIVTEQKPLDEILTSLEPYKKILVLGCDGCTQPPRGLKEAEVMAELVTLAGKLNDKGFDCKTFTLSRTCDNKILERNLAPELEGIDAVLTMACGIGPQTIVEVFPDTRVIPAQNTLFFGSEKMEDALLVEKCGGCGDCVLVETEGICPIARCSKNLLNGPCGGTTGEGKCEVSTETDCAWYLIFKRFEALGLLDRFTEVKPPKDWRPAGHGGPRNVVREELKLTEKPKPEEEETKPEGGGKK
jgi:hypothetical protein